MRAAPLILLLIGMASAVHAQQTGTITLLQCFDWAAESNPLMAQGKLLDESSAVQSSIYEKANLPQFNLNAQATYQSAVTELPFHVPGISIPEIPKEQYKASLDINQLIYGAGMAKSQKSLEMVNLQINKTNIETELYKTRDRISQLYLGILWCDNNILVIQNTLSELENRLNRIKSGIRNGIVLPSSESVMQVEILKTEQKLVELKSQRSSLVSMLGILTGKQFPDSTLFEVPRFQLPATATNLRPEYKWFGMQTEKNLKLKTLADKRDYPRVYGFGSAGYGRPGLNMFKEEADFFYIVGAKATWNFWNWHQTRQEKAMLDLSAGLIDNQRKAYELNLQVQLAQYLSEIQKLEKLIAGDEEILQLRKSITRSAAAQLENGTITTTDYLTEYNAETAAELQAGIHKIQLIQAQAAYLVALGLM